MSGPRELELKLEIGQADLASLKSRRLPRLAGGRKGTKERLAAVYFDTRQHDLRKRGLSLRVRTIGERHIQTIKEAGSGAGVFDRPEWESEVAGREPDLQAAALTPVQAILSDRRAGGLRPVFAAEVDRTTWVIESGESAIEIALDEGEIAVDGRASPIAELELELKRGSATDLFALARKLDTTGALKLGVLTKSEQGYRLAAGDGQKVAKAEPVGLTRGMGSAEAFATIARACIRHFRLNEPLVVEARSADALHQARVAMRRLRSAFSLFRDLIADPEMEAIRQGLREISAELGEARNLDVYLERAEAGDGAGGDPAWIAHLKAEREAAYDRIAKTLASKRFRRLMLDLLAWVEIGPWRMSQGAGARKRLERPIEELAAEILEKRSRRVRRRGRNLAEIEPEARHQVRIDAKKVRYASEFFSGLVEDKRDRKRLKAFLTALEDLQGCLGDLNDIETGREIVAARVKALGPDAAGPDGLAEVDESKVPQLLASAEAAHRAFAQAKPFWGGFA